MSPNFYTIFTSDVYKFSESAVLQFYNYVIARHTEKTESL